MLIITSIYPPERCGVGDYTYNLLQTKEAANWTLLYFKDWSLKTFFEKIKEINNYEDKWINLQYPSIGYGDSILPHLLCIYFSMFSRKKIAITIHEYTQYGWKGKAAMFVMLLFASKLIFTNNFERNAAIKVLSLVAQKSRVIKIFSNINSATVIPTITDRQYDVGYFGYIAPSKGIEDFLSVAENLKKENPRLNCYIMGQIQPVNEQYANSIIQHAEKSGIEMFLNKEKQDVAEILSRTKITFLPFPDGISERRGSFLAAVNNACIVVTTNGKFVTPALMHCCEITSISQAANKISDILSDREKYDERQEKIKDYLRQEVPQSWSEVATQYNDFLK